MGFTDRGGGGPLVWQRSTFCSESGCVEVAVSGGTVLLRNSESPDGPVLQCSDSVWRVFLRGVMAGNSGLGQPGDTTLRR